jgi:hypothetical protein
MPLNETRALLAPAAVLVVWTLLVLVWMAFTRFSAFRHANIDLGKAKPGGRGQNLEGVLPDKAMWPSHNYTHLLEQPTLFYAVVVILAMMGQVSPINIALAWTYVGLRILHSLWQIRVNLIPARFLIFMVSTGVLIALAVRAVIAAIA